MATTYHSPDREYTLTWFKKSGKWYQDITITFPFEPKGYANEEDIRRAASESAQLNLGPTMHWVMMETPWGFPYMIPARHS